MDGQEQLRSTIDDSGLCMALIGMPGIEKRISPYPELFSRIGFVHEFRPLPESDVEMLLRSHWAPNGVELPKKEISPEVSAAISQLIRGNFRLLARLLTQMQRVVEIDQLSEFSIDVVETARENLVRRRVQPADTLMCAKPFEQNRPHNLAAAGVSFSMNQTACRGETRRAGPRGGRPVARGASAWRNALLRCAADAGSRRPDRLQEPPCVRPPHRFRPRLRLTISVPGCCRNHLATVAASRSGAGRERVPVLQIAEDCSVAMTLLPCPVVDANYTRSVDRLDLSGQHARSPKSDRIYLDTPASTQSSTQGSVLIRGQKFQDRVVTETRAFFAAHSE